ncbi:peptidylprolyl isomerase [Halobacillus salinarum]|uniref:Foldase protein PrsA n=1 Tax=Halobacillus salinarum TaxID=2932257 RepID=A0ABY4EHH8_9BACI|nr:peptidylprolyl isomerase [Halobacillus salinarum]UOQ43513.1 peptidylprolyl isomerase [Halobacillus salinarum]
MKKVLISAALAASVFSLSACSSSGDDSKVVVETKDGNVTKDEFYEELKDKYGEEILQKMVMMEVLSDKYDVSDKAVNKELESLKKQYGDQFQMVLQQSGFSSEDEFKKTIRLSLLQEKAAGEDVDISEKEMKDYYEKMKTEIQASHILVSDEKTAKEVEKKLKNGGDFTKLAKEYSTDTGSAKKGGQLGYFGPGKMAPEFENAAYKLDKGEVSEPVKTQFGYHIIKVTDKRKNEDVKPYDEAKSEIKRTLISQKVNQQQLQSKIDKLMKDADIKVKDDQFKDLFKEPESTSASTGSDSESDSGSSSDSDSGSDSSSDSDK